MQVYVQTWFQGPEGRTANKLTSGRADRVTAASQIFLIRRLLPSFPELSSPGPPLVPTRPSSVRISTCLPPNPYPNGPPPSLPHLPLFPGHTPLSFQSPLPPASLLWLISKRGLGCPNTSCPKQLKGPVFLGPMEKLTEQGDRVHSKSSIILLRVPPPPPPHVW